MNQAHRRPEFGVFGKATPRAVMSLERYNARMHFLAKYGGSPDPQTLDLSDFAVEHDAIDAAGRLHAVAGFLRVLDTLDDYTHPRDWGADADQLEALADALTDNVAAEALSRQHQDVEQA